MVIPSLDLDDVRRLACDYLGHDEKVWEERDLPGQMSMALSVLNHVPKNTRCGVHTTKIGSKIDHMFNYAFDFRDEEGNLLLPFTEEQPLLIAAAPYTDEKKVFPELEKLHSAKMGVYTTKTRDYVARNPHEQKFDTFWVKYMTGEMKRVPLHYAISQVELERNLVDLMKQKLAALMKRDPEETRRREILARIEKLENEVKELKNEPPVLNPAPPTSFQERLSSRPNGDIKCVPGNVCFIADCTTPVKSVHTMCGPCAAYQAERMCSFCCCNTKADITDACCTRCLSKTEACPTLSCGNRKRPVWNVCTSCKPRTVYCTPDHPHGTCNRCKEYNRDSTDSQYCRLCREIRYNL